MRVLRVTQDIRRDPVGRSHSERLIEQENTCPLVLFYPLGPVITRVFSIVDPRRTVSAARRSSPIVSVTKLGIETVGSQSTRFVW